MSGLVKARVGVFGGTFNPVHNGHLHLARGFYGELALDEVLMIPTYLPPHKSGADMAAPGRRLELCRAAAEGLPWLRVSDLELAREGRSYTVVTLRELRAERPDAEFFLLMGADMFLTLREWYCFPEIARLATLCCARRDGVPEAALCAYAKGLTKAFGAKCHIARFSELAVSSTQVRRLAARGEPVDAVVPPAAARLIAGWGLYKSPVG